MKEHTLDLNATQIASAVKIFTFHRSIYRTAGLLYVIQSFIYYSNLVFNIVVYLTVL